MAIELGRWWDIEIWYPTVTDPWSVDLPTRPGLELAEAASELALYDLVLYCMGNSLPNHEAIYQAAREVPGVVILHDVVLHGFFAGYYLRFGPARYLTELEKVYGPEVRAASEAKLLSIDKQGWEPHDQGRYPFFEPAVEGALGVVTHSAFGRHQVQGRFLGPIGELSLPHSKREGHGRRGSGQSIAQDRFVLLTIGHLNRNKRIEAVLRSLASDGRLSSRCTYLLAGPCGERYRQELEGLIDELGLEAQVHLLGYVDDAELATLVERADVCLNLRQPCTEAASASLVEEMWHGKAVIVTDIGSYSEIPDDCVVKTAPDEEIESIAEALHCLLSQPETTARIGGKARAYARDRYRPDRYASELVAFVDSLAASRPILGLADQLGRQLAKLGVTAGMPSVVEVCRAATELFAGNSENRRPLRVDVR